MACAWMLFSLCHSLDGREGTVASFESNAVCHTAPSQTCGQETQQLRLRRAVELQMGPAHQLFRRTSCCLAYSRNRAQQLALMILRQWQERQPQAQAQAAQRVVTSPLHCPARQHSQRQGRHQR